LTINGTQFFIEYWNERINISTGLIGMFNLYNVLGAFAAGITLALPIDCMISGISNLKTVRGRFERITSTKGWTVIIDYAHTPDALEKCLLTIKEIVGVGGKVITVFGAGGDRDKAKRPLMGKVVSRLSDKIYLTSDNPRTENPDKIIDDIAEGIPKGIKVIKESNRRKAINDALLSAQSGDVVLVAGKGHEEYQIVGTERIHFSDREVVEDIIFNM
jgi:UDP-N-acetylmuramoyl-L-alanyl-D-glutamate--2,6-diaminopimelate ligase